MKTEQIMTLRKGDSRVAVYRTPAVSLADVPTYYFACSCGNCGRRSVETTTAVNGAVRHVMDHG